MREPSAEREEEEETATGPLGHCQDARAWPRKRSSHLCDLEKGTAWDV